MLKRVLPVAAAAAAALLTALPASAQTYTFSAMLTGANESPAVTSNGGGSAVVVFTSSNFTVSVAEFFSGLNSGLSDNHIHCCTTVPEAGTVGVALGFTNLPIGATSGNYFNTFALTQTAYNSLLAGALTDRAYVNIHTTTSPSGEIRGFLRLTNVTPIPEPGTYAMMLGGLAAVGFVARRRRQG